MPGTGIGKFARIIIGLVFILAGVAKAMDLNFFYYVLKTFPLGLSDPALLWLARGFIALEIILGTALLFNIWPRLVLPATFIVMMVFLAVTAWNLMGGLSEDCGCFGKLVRLHPAVEVVVEMVLLFITVVAWRFTQPGGGTGRFKTALMGAAVVVGIGLPYLFPESRPKIFAKEGVGSYVGDLKPDRLNADLAKGDYFLALIETDCEHCQAAMPKLNELAKSHATPKLVAVCPNTPEELDWLKAKMRLDFPVGFVPVRKFLLLHPEIPALLWVKAGVVRHSWPIDSTPTVTEALRVLKEGGAIEKTAKLPTS
ncbi:MAG: DoxX family membrane protein [candidate division Zixibacteria bacterium]|nr:DoxX family membrane protein [candidate division Zixibacteria bacterium]